MADLNACLYDESLQKGTDYTDSRKVKTYDEKMSRFRDYLKESDLIVRTLGLKAHEHVLDIGCGTGGLTLHVARSCAWMTALDVSRPMLEYARKKTEAADIHNVTFQVGGFLTHGQADASMDAVVTNAALHHLPDFWKMIALFKINRLLKEEGRLFLGDVVFHYPPEQYRERSLSWIQSMAKTAGEEEEAKNHLKDEYSTFGWILEEMLKRAGFEWEQVGGDDYFAQYRCRKVRDFPEWGAAAS